MVPYGVIGIYHGAVCYHLVISCLFIPHVTGRCGLLGSLDCDSLSTAFFFQPATDYRPPDLMVGTIRGGITSTHLVLGSGLSFVPVRLIRIQFIHNIHLYPTTCCLLACYWPATGLLLAY